MAEKPTLIDLAFDAQPIPDDIDIPTAVVGTAEPPALKHALNDVFVAGALASIRISDDRPQAKEAELEKLLDKPSSFSQRKAARRILENALAAQQHAQAELFVIEPELKLAYEVDSKIMELSSPARWAAAFMSALALGGSLTTIGYQASHESNQRARASAIEYNETSEPGYQIPVPTTELSDGQKTVVIAAGAFAAAMGGIMGSLAGLGMSGRVAHNRAKRQLEKASISIS